MSDKKKYIPKSKQEVLAELKQIDKFNLLEVKAKEKQATPESILISKFEEINNFIDEYKRVPTDKGGGPIEFQLFSRLLEIQLDYKKIKVLKEYDRYQLLKNLETNEEESLIYPEDIEEVPNTKIGLTDTFNLLKMPGSSIFDLKNVKSKEEKVTTMPEEVARRKKCADFETFEPLFKKCQIEIENGDRKIVKFRDEQDVKQGAFFIYGGVKCYVAEVGEREVKNNRNNARLRLIFENGLESNMYHRSLTAELYKDGRRILPPRLSEGEAEIDEKDLTGFIYVLSSKSIDSQIKSVPNLYKIGFSTTPVKERVKYAKSDPTYLMAEVQIVASYKVAGIKPVYFENLIHKLFDHVKLNIEVIDKNGKKVVPKEWYSVPLDVIDDALKMIQTGEIIEYMYDDNGKKLIKI